jgi:tetratricopeptide (TPR) repeat protein
VLRLIVDTRPDRIARAFEVLSQHLPLLFRDQTRPYDEALRALVAAARTRLPELSKEGAAHAAYQLLSVEHEVNGGEPQRWPFIARSFVERYTGTEAALLAEASIIASGAVSATQLEALDTFAREHPGSVAGAKALYLKGFKLQSNVAISGLFSRTDDPTNRFMEVLVIVKELESGRYPPCEWVEKAASLVVEFSVFEPKIATGNSDRMLEAYQSFVTSHFVLDDLAPASNGVGYVVTTKMPELFALKRDGIAGMERVLSALERGAADAGAVRYLRGHFYLKRLESAHPAERRALVRKAAATLAALSSLGEGLYHRKALASLASLYFRERDYANARDAYRKYLRSYPRSDWAWVAALRIGQCEEGLGESKAAVNAYRTAGATYASVPLAAVLGHTYAARALEAVARFDEALNDYQQALQEWDDDYGELYSLYVIQRHEGEPFLPTDTAEVRKASLQPRIRQLQRSAELPGGTLLERGRWLIDKGRHKDAMVPLARLVAQYPESAAVADARYLLHRAGLERALELADVENPTGKQRAAVAELTRLSREPSDFIVCAAKIARAAMLWKQGASARAQARALMLDALKEWQAVQGVRQPPQPQAGVEEDVAQIHALVFRPRGDGVFSGSTWNAFSWPATLPQFIVVHPEVSVELSNGVIVSVEVPRVFPDSARVLFLDAEQIALFTKVITRLGGTKNRHLELLDFADQTPNQPIGASLTIMEFWNQFFPTRPGHWGGWELETYPIITQIAFLDDDRTKAVAHVVVGYSGATVVLEKESGTWRAKRLVNQWVT